MGHNHHRERHHTSGSSPHRCNWRRCRRRKPSPGEQWVFVCVGCGRKRVGFDSLMTNKAYSKFIFTFSLGFSRSTVLSNLHTCECVVEIPSFSLIISLCFTLDQVGLTPSDGRCALLATYRFPQDDAAPCAKARLRFRANEGEAGEVTASIVSRTSPRAAQVVKFQVCCVLPPPFF